MAQLQISEFGLSTEVSAGVAQTEGDMYILLMHSNFWYYSQWKSIRIISGGENCSRPVLCCDDRQTVSRDTF
jgi:hypothetical protein